MDGVEIGPERADQVIAPLTSARSSKLMKTDVRDML